MRPARAVFASFIGRAIDKLLGPTTRAESLGLYVALATIGILTIGHFSTEGRSRREQTKAIGGQADAIQRQADAIVATNRQSHFDDCLGANNVRQGLRENVIRGEKTLPLLLRLLPQLNNAEVLRVNGESIRRQLRDFRPRDCVAYAEQAVPRSERKKYRGVPLIAPGSHRVVVR